MEFRHPILLAMEYLTIVYICTTTTYWIIYGRLKFGRSPNRVELIKCNLETHLVSNNNLLHITMLNVFSLSYKTNCVANANIKCEIRIMI